MCIVASIELKSYFQIVSLSSVMMIEIVVFVLTELKLTSISRGEEKGSRAFSVSVASLQSRSGQPND